MNRSGYDDGIDDTWQWIMYRGRVASALRGLRGQTLLREALVALDAMPDKRLVSGEFQEGGSYCVLGAVGAARGIDMHDWKEKLYDEDYTAVAAHFNIANVMLREVMWVNDDGNKWKEDEAARWVRVREWIVEQLESASQRRTTKTEQ